MYKVMKVASIGSIICGIPAFMLMRIGNAASYFLGLAALDIWLAAFGACLPALLVTAFEPEVRYTAVAVGYNTAMAIFAGLGPIICTALVRGGGGSYGGDVSPGIVIMLLGVISLVAVIILGRKKVSYAQFDRGSSRAASTELAAVVTVTGSALAAKDDDYVPPNEL